MPFFAPIVSSARFARTTLLLCVCFFAIVGCSSQKAGLRAPELPAKHWLDETPGVPVENKAKLEASVPNLYEPGKVFTFEDCVFLTIQQSPLLVNSAVNLEIKRLALTSAVWKYLPEPSMNVRLSNNITAYNSDSRNIPGDYARPKFRVGFYAGFPNPVATYFEHQVQKVMVNLAIAAHRRAVGEVIGKVAESYLKLQAQQKIMAAQKDLQPGAKDLIKYWQQVEAVDGRQGVSLNLAVQHEKEIQLTLEKTAMQEVMQRTKLKILSGVDPQHKLDVDTKSADEILAGFDGHSLQWDSRWPTTENELLLRAQVKLADYNIMVSWAKYIPDMSIAVNNDPPSGQYQPVDGREDTFVHLNFDFPLLDWGRRYRGVQTARMEKAQAFHEMARKRTDYSNTWLQAEQRTAMALTQLKLAKTRLDTADLQYKESSISFNEGTEQLPAVAQRQEALTNARIAHIEAELEYKLAKLEWMLVANLLQERFLGLPAKEVI